MDGSRRNVVVRVGAGRRAPSPRSSPRLVVVGVAPPGAAWVSEHLPECRIRETRHATSQAAVEHLRIPAGSDLSSLPGLNGRLPSLVRDAVGLALSSGLAEVDLVLARARGHAPWDLWRTDAYELVEPFLAGLRCTLVTVPDAVGPSVVGIERYPVEARLENVERTAIRLAPGLGEAFQTAVLDLPLEARGASARAPDDHAWVRSVKAMVPVDAALVAWEGTEVDLERHGWRSGAALVAGLVASAQRVEAPIVGTRVRIAGGRAVTRPRWQALGVPEWSQVVPEVVADQCVRLHLAEDQVTVASQPTLRPPLGSWSVPMMRVVKLIHHRIVTAANVFVFRDANAAQALSLQAALRMALADFVKHEIVEGPGGSDQPAVHTYASPDPAEPALVGTVSAYLRPWLHTLQVNLAVRPGQPARVEVF